MGKSAGHIRASKWENSIYHEGDVRKEYDELSEGRGASLIGYKHKGMLK